MIGKNIFEIRKRRGLTLSELAERAKISKSYLSNIERNLNQNPSIQVVEKIAQVLGVELKTLINSEQDYKPIVQIDDEWIDFVNELKETDIEKEHIKEYKTIFEFIKWKNRNINQEK